MDMPFRIAKIIHHYIAGQISPEARIELILWLRESARHRKMFRDFCRGRYVEETSGEHRIFDATQGYLRFLRDKAHIDRYRLWRKIASVAAIFICLLEGGYWFNKMVKQEKSDTNTTASIGEPGRSRAILILGNGEKINLTDSLHFELIDQTTKITVQGDQIFYPVGNDSVNHSVNKIMVPRGGEYKLTLSDGTRVWLNAETKLTYPVNFDTDHREVEVIGEAYFEVAKDKYHPFIVKMEGMEVKVLGTSFNVKAYPNETKQTTLVEGMVQVSASGRMFEIRPGEQVCVEENGVAVRQVEALTFVAWKDRRFSFTDELLEDVVKKLERWYDVHFFIQNDILREIRFTGNLPKYENMDQVLKMLELTTSIRFVQKGRTVVVEKEY